MLHTLSSALRAYLCLLLVLVHSVKVVWFGQSFLDLTLLRKSLHCVTQTGVYFRMAERKNLLALIITSKDIFSSLGNRNHCLQSGQCDYSSIEPCIYVDLIRWFLCDAVLVSCNFSS